MIKLPEIILREDASIIVEYINNFSPAQTKKVIHIRGNRSGFFVLSNATLYMVANLNTKFRKTKKGVRFIF